jgi:predicted metal-binding protein
MASKSRMIHTKTMEEIRMDLDNYRNLAITLGATDAKVITTDQVIIDERVRMKCLNPVCREYGSNIHCPPHMGSLDQMKKLVDKYRYALLIMIRVPSKDLVGPEAKEKKTSRISSRKMDEIVSKIESAAFYDGHHLATGFASGCKSLWCPDEECSALRVGGTCRHPLRARAGMDAVGMNAYTMASQAGWDIYPAGEDAKPENLPHGTRLGIVLIE